VAENALEKAESLQFDKLPYAVVKLAQENRDDVDALLVDMTFEHPTVSLNRAQARGLIKYAVREMEQDETASAPSSQEILTSKIDRALQVQIDRLEYENRELARIEVSDPEEDYYIGESSLTISPSDAGDLIQRNIEKLLEIKKSLNESKKANASVGGGLNMEINIQNHMSDALQNIKDVEAKVVDV